MTSEYTELRLQVCRYASSAPTDLVISPYQLTLCVVLKDHLSLTDIQDFLSSILTWDYFYRSQAQGFVIYSGSEEPWSALTDIISKDKVFWSHVQPSIFTDFEGFAILRGSKILHKISSIPRDLTLYLPAKPPAIANTELADRLETGDTSDLIAAYYEAQTHYPDMNLLGIKYLLTSLSSLYNADFTQAEDWFTRPMYGADKMDVITPEDVNLKQFLRRFRNFLVNNVDTNKPKHAKNRKEGEGRVAALEKRLRECDNQLKALFHTLSERDSTISLLLHRIESSEQTLNSLRSSKLHTSHSEDPSFWQMSPKMLEKAPSLKEIAANKTLWIMDKVNSEKETGGVSVGGLNPRPKLEPIVRKVSSRIARSGEWRSTKPR